MNSTTHSPVKFCIKTFGCKVNQYESQLIRENLVRSGYIECGAGDKPDIFIINSCTVTENADKDVRYSVARAHRMISGASIVVTGCYAEKDEAAIAALPGVSKVIKNSDKNHIASILLNTPRPAGIDRRGRQYSIRNTNTISGFQNHTKAFVKIQDGCENFCSYCKVPYVRGPFKSRPIEEIVEETTALVSKGFKEVVLTGICLGAWGVEKGQGLCDVLEALNAVKGDFRIRLSSIEPKYVTDELVGFMASRKNICRHLHIPLQSGDDDILAGMNRPYTAKKFMALVEKARSKVDGIAITTDVMIGFPGEEDKNFNNTLNFVKEMSPARTHIFTYSRRDGTAACGMGDLPSPNILKKRFADLAETAASSSYSFRKQFTGKTVNVLAESRRDRITGLLAGYSDNYIRILFLGPDSIMKTIVPVNINEVNANTTMGSYAG